VLKLRRTHDWYSVWKFFDADGAFLRWYVNFETPVHRTADGVEVNDLQLDIVIAPDGDWRWKDVEHLAPSMSAARITADELLAALDAAAEVADLLERDERWWAPWDDWTPADGTIGA
jgi:predicted RNA-binding protein associated with RNAse of E/G family